MFEIELFICIKIDLTLNNIQGLICHKTKLNSLLYYPSHIQPKNIDTERIVIITIIVFYKTDESSISGFVRSLILVKTLMANWQTSNELLKTFQRLCLEYLKPQERKRLVRGLKRFERSCDVVELVETIVTILDTPEKKSALYPVVYELIPVSCRQSYQEIFQRKLLHEEDIHRQTNMHPTISGLLFRDNFSK